MAASAEALPLAPIQEKPKELASGELRALDGEKDNIAQLSEISKNSQTNFLTIILVCVYSYLTIATTTDPALVSNSSATALPLLQANVPVVWFYYLAPIILTALYIYFHVYLESFWRGLTRLPMRHPDGRGLDDYIYPWFISCALIRGRFRELSSLHRLSARLEAWIGLLLGWWLVPIVLLFYWGRYVVAHDWLGTGIQVGLIILSTCVGLTHLLVSRNALNSVSDSAAPGQDPALTRHQRLIVVATSAFLGAILIYLSNGAFYGLRAEDCERSDADPDCTRFGAARHIWLSALRQEPHADVRGFRFVARPHNWADLEIDTVALTNYLDAQRGLIASKKDLRNLMAANAFLPGSRLVNTVLDRANFHHSVLSGSRLEGVSLLGATLTDAAFQHAEIISSELEQVSAVASRFDHARLFASGMSGDFSSASFNDSSGDNIRIGTPDAAVRTKLNGASLKRVAFGLSKFSMVDFGDAAIEDTRMVNSIFVEADFSGTKMRESFFSFSHFIRCRFQRTAMDQVFFEEASFEASDLVGDSRAIDLSNGGSPNARPRTVVNGFRGVLARFDGETRISNLEFRGGELREARFAGTKLSNVLFFGMDLSNAYFDQVDFSAVFFINVDLSGADLLTSTNLTPKHLAGACGNRSTKLPPGLKVSVCRPGRPR